jgi:MFS family permease
MREELGFGVAALGVAVGTFRLVGAVLAPRLGSLVDRVGPVPAMRAAALLTFIASSGIALQAKNWGALVGYLALAGAASSLAQTGANISLVRAVKEKRQGFAFALKQSALPASSAVAGLAVPIIVLTLGWRSAYWMAAILAVIVGAYIPRAQDQRITASRRTMTPGPPLGSEIRWLVVGMFFSMCAATTLSAFTVDSAVDAGLSPARAGVLLTVGSLLSITVRLVVGARADRREGGHITTCSRLVLAGSFGYLLMGLQTAWSVPLGILVAFGLGWGFNGLFIFAVVRLYKSSPGAASGRALSAGSLGGLIGPTTFGFVVQWAGYPVAWSLATVWAISGAGLLLVGRTRIRVAREGLPPSDLP